VLLAAVLLLLLLWGTDRRLSSMLYWQRCAAS
jgi:hypothetical protein